MVEAIKREIADASFRYRHEVDEEKRIVVGVNRYAAETEDPLEILRIPAELERKQIGRVQAVRAGRDGERADAAPGHANLMEPLLDCARAGCTEGEIVQALQRVFGGCTETPVF